jgi:hypothetical protein
VTLSATAAVLAAILPAAAPASAREVPAHPTPMAMLAIGTGDCPGIRGPTDTGGNPCLAFLGLEAGVRAGFVQASVLYEGRELVDALSLFYLARDAQMTLGGSLGVAGEPGALWRLSLAGEAGWHLYRNYGPVGPRHGGATGTTYAGARGTVAFGMRSTRGPTARLAATLSWRRDLQRRSATQDGVAFQLGGTSLTFLIGMLADF